MPIYLSQSPRNAYSNFSNAFINVHNGEISPPGGGEDFYKPIIRRRCNEVTRDEMVSFYRGQETETKGESERSWRTSKGRVRVSLLRADTHSTWKSNSILHEMSLETLSLPLSFTRRFINSVSTETWLKNPQSACCHEANNTLLSKEVLVLKIYKARPCPSA